MAVGDRRGAGPAAAIGAPARYFPVDRRPLHMRPRLQPFPSDFGNGKADALHFQRDDQAPRYLSAKQPGRYRVARGEAEDRAHSLVLDWMERTFVAEHPDLARPLRDMRNHGRGTPSEDDPAARYAALAAVVQEDFVVQLREGDRDRAIAVYVSFPSSWRPETILGWSFREIHEPVPDFADTDAQSASLVSAMVERGPYVRFVWTVCADDALDHHPEAGLRRAFGPETREGWLRVERQLTLPFPQVDASLFLIRTYLRAFGSLGALERETLAMALQRLPSSTGRYKGLERGLPRALEILAALASAPAAAPGREPRP